MYSLKHVLWRGTMALSLLTLGAGGVGLRQAPLQAETGAPVCDGDAGGMTQLHIVDPRRVDDHALALLVVSQSRKRS
jgi:hypothetical protein